MPVNAGQRHLQKLTTTVIALCKVALRVSGRAETCWASRTILVFGKLSTIELLCRTSRRRATPVLQPCSNIQPCSPLVHVPTPMGNNTSSQTPAAEPKATAGTTLWGSWDKPVASAYVTKQQQSKSAKSGQKGAAGTNAAGEDAANAAPGSSVQVQAGAGLHPAAAVDNIPGLKPAGKEQSNLSHSFRKHAIHDRHCVTWVAGSISISIS